MTFLQVADETDELLLADDQIFDVDPEALPRQLLSDFSVYNLEVNNSYPSEFDSCLYHNRFRAHCIAVSAMDLNR